MGAAPMAFVLWDSFLRFNPKNPNWFNRDRFVLSAGHGSMLQYALLYLTGYDSVTIEDIKQFRQWESKTPGHPENFMTPGVEVTTDFPFYAISHDIFRSNTAGDSIYARDPKRVVDLRNINHVRDRSIAGFINYHRKGH